MMILLTVAAEGEKCNICDLSVDLFRILCIFNDDLDYQLGGK